MSTQDINITPKSLTDMSVLLGRHRRELLDGLEDILSKTKSSPAIGGMNSQMIKLSGSLKEQREELTRLINTLRRSQKDLTVYERYMLGAAQRQRESIDKQIKAVDDSTTSTNDNSQSTDDNTRQKRKNSEAIKAATEYARDFAISLAKGEIHLTGFRQAVGEIGTSFKHGLNWNMLSDTFDAALMGMDPKEMMEFQAAMRRTSGTLNGGIREFDLLIKDAQYELLRYTGSLKDGGIAMGQFYEMSHSIGLNVGMVDDSVNGMVDQFKQMQTVTSMTIEQFTELTKSFVNDGDVKSKLLTLQGKQRAMYVQSLQQQVEMFYLSGMQIDAAKKLVDFINHSSNAKPLDRLQQGVRMQAYAGHLGLSPEEGRTITDLMLKRVKSNDEVMQYKELMSKVVEREGEYIRNRGFSGELELSVIKDKLGITDVDQFHDAALQQSAQQNVATLGRHQVDLQAEANSLLGSIKESMKVVADVAGGWSPSAAAAWAGAIVAVLLGKGLIGRMIYSQENKAKIAKLFKRDNGTPINPPPPGSNPPASGGTPPGSPTPPVPPNNPNADPPNSPRRSWLKLLGATSVAAIAGTALASAIPNADEVSPENRSLVAGTNGFVAGATTGATIGAMVSPFAGPLAPLVPLIGGAIGGGIGVMTALADTQSVYEEKAKDLLALTTKTQSLESIKLNAEKASLQTSIASIKAKTDATTAELAMVKQMEARVDSINQKLTSTDVQADLAGIKIATTTLSSMIEDRQKKSFGDTEDIADTLADMKSAVKIGGVNFDAMQAYTQALQSEAYRSGMLNDPKMVAEYQEMMKGIQAGEDVNLSRSQRDLANRALQQIMPAFQQAAQATTARVVSDPEIKGSISDVVRKTTDESAAATQRVEDLQRQLIELKQSSGNGVRPVGDRSRLEVSREIRRLETELETAKLAARAAQDTAHYLEQAILGNAQLSVRLSKEDIAELGKAAKERASPIGVLPINM